jgi:predicted ATPase
MANPECHCISLVGPGGIGKTRLALQTAEQHRADFAHGVAFIPLASVGSVEAAIPAIAGAIRLSFYGPDDPKLQLLNSLCEKHMLLILDNVEQLLVEGPLQANIVELVPEILQRAPGVKLLVTSREVLNLQGEWVFEVRGLAFPETEQTRKLDEYAAVALFMQRARRASPRSTFDEADLAGIAHICRLVEGMPLAIELAATWLRILSPAEIAREIEGSLDFLSASLRDLPERHRSMRVVFDRSWQRLSAREQQVLSHLSIFWGGFSRQAAEQVAGASLPVLSTLVNRTLLRRAAAGRYELHELVRQYAERKLAEDPGEQERVKDRHATYYVRCLAEWENALKGPQQLETLNEMAQMISNLRQGWRWMLVNGKFSYLKSDQFNSRLFHSSSFSLSLFYEMRWRSWEAVSLFTEVVEFLKAVRAAPERLEDFCRFNSVLGTITAYLGLHQMNVYQHAKARENLEEAIHLLENSQSRLERAQAQSILGWSYFQQGKMQRSAELLKQSLASYQEERNTWWYLVSSVYLAQVYVFSGNLSESESICQEVSRFGAPGDLRLEIPLKRIYAYLYYFRKQYVEAEQLMQVNLQLAYQYKNHRVIIANRLTDLCRVALATNRNDVAEKYIQECIDLVSEYGESYELAFAMLYLGKCFVARSEIEAGRDQFRQVIKMGHAFDAFYLVYWGMVNIARTYMVEGQIEKALEISLVLKDCSVEYKIAQDEGNYLLADLQAMLPKEQVEAVMKQVNGRIPADQAGAAALAYALEHVTE